MKFGKDRMLQDSGILFLLNMFASLLNYVCQLLLAKVLSVEGFGTINTIFSFLLIVGVPGTTLTMVVAKKYAEKNDSFGVEERKTYIGTLIKYLLIAGAVLFVIGLFFSKLLKVVLAIDDMIVLGLALFLGALGFFQPTFSGVFSGNKRFVLVGIYSLCIPLYKIASIFFGRIISKDDTTRLYIILLFMVLGTIAVAGYGYKKTKHILGEVSLFSKERVEFSITKEEINILIINIGLMVYMNVDLLLVRFYGAPEESGLYSAVLLFGRVIYYFSTTLGTILLPKVAAQKDNSKEITKLLGRTIGLLLLFAMLSVIAIYVFGPLALKILFGAEYIGAQKYFFYVVMISISLSICTVLINYLVAIENTTYAMVTLIVMNLFIFIFAIFVSRIEILLSFVVIVGVLGTTILALLAHGSCLRNRTV